MLQPALKTLYLKKKKKKKKKKIGILTFKFYRWKFIEIHQKYTRSMALGYV